LATVISAVAAEDAARGDPEVLLMLLLLVAW